MKLTHTFYPVGLLLVLLLRQVLMIPSLLSLVSHVEFFSPAFTRNSKRLSVLNLVAEFTLEGNGANISTRKGKYHSNCEHEL